MSHAFSLAIIAMFVSLPTFAQPAQQPRVFEVASVKLNEDMRTRPSISTSGARFTAQAKNIVTLIMYAYNVRYYQVARTKALGVLEDDRFDISARSSGDNAPRTEEFRQMLEALLSDRFKLRAHREMREMPVYTLVTGKNGPKFKESPPDTAPGERYAASGRNYVVTLSKATMDNILVAIENSYVDRPVLDRTGLQGMYDITLTYTPDVKPIRDAGPSPDDITIFTAVQKQLGLELVPAKAMVEIIVVDQIERPSPN